MEEGELITITISPVEDPFAKDEQKDRDKDRDRDKAKDKHKDKEKEKTDQRNRFKVQGLRIRIGTLPGQRPKQQSEGKRYETV